ncbi:sensor histidine kinase [Solimicrobium silvestre]|uniref:histidine kinase n=1 Tax=Solimicrobium silvestre TaxID=2099400 RepID=A0A2S9GTR6_9BURK|nr:hybrid sensor histidine kinase/response regulator [Solimicrobium silvestre]PRC91101.1 Response regulator receiver domain [Solimicrobium silvestre]
MGELFKILAVDDNQGNRFLLNELLARLPDVEVIEASSGAEALLRTVEHDFQLILLDVHMPIMDGYETARLLQMTSRTRNIPIVFLTAVFKSEEFIKRGYALGAVDYLTKPLDDNIFLNRVRHYQHLQDRENRLITALSEMRSMQDNLLQSEKLSALGAMVAGVSHELNTPLGNSKLAISTMHDRLNELNRHYLAGTIKRSNIEEFIKESLDIVVLANRSIERALNLVVTFKQVAVDQTSEQRRLFDLATVINETITSLRPSFKHDPWQFDIEIPAGIQMDSYPGPLEQIIINLVHNSIRHGFDGRGHGCITIRASTEENDLSQKLVTIVFKDDGNGIAPNNIGRVFDPFFTTRLGRGGSGIGLNITHRIATSLLAGSIHVESEFGFGATFTLTVPCKVHSAI